MSKNDKKRIAELERQQSILLATMRVLRKDFNTLSLSIVHDKIDAIRAANSFQAGTIPSEKEQGKTEQSNPILNEETRQNFVRAGRNWGKLFSFEADEEYIKIALSRLEKQQEKTQQPQQTEAEKEQELMAQLNAELAKFATLEAFNTERANRGLPAIDKLEFDKAKSVFDYAIATAKVLRPQWYDKIDQIKIPQTEQEKPEQSQPEKTKTEQNQSAHCEAILDDLGCGETAYNQHKRACESWGKTTQNDPDETKEEPRETFKRTPQQAAADMRKSGQELMENHRENLGEPVLNNAAQFKKGLPKTAQINRISPEEREENIAKEDWESRKQISAEQLDASLSKLAELPLKSEQELAEAKRTNRINAALKDAVDCLTKHLNFTLENFGKDRDKQVKMLQAYCDHFKEDLSDFRRKVLSVSELVGQSKVKPKEAAQEEPKQDETTPPELEQGKVWIIQTNLKKEERLNSFYVEDVSLDGLVLHTPNPNQAIQYSYFAQAQKLINKIISGGAGRYKAADFKIVQADAKRGENEAEKVETEQRETWMILKKPNSLILFVEREPAHYATEQDAENAIINAIWDGELSGEIGDYKAVLYSDYFDKSEQLKAEQSEPILPAPEQKEAEKSGSELGGTWLIYDKIDKAWAAKCSEGGFYWSSKQDDFMLKFASEAEAKQRYDTLCSRGLISRIHRANSVVIRKE